MVAMINDVRTAVGFLTRIPVGDIHPYDPTLSRASGFFPLVGVVAAGVGIAAWWAGTELLGPAAGAVLSVLSTVAVTGAFHEDGLADTVDGLWGGATRERRLEIMRDSRLGTYGTAALAGDLLLRAAILLPYADGDLGDVARILIAAHVIGRAVPVALAVALPAVRTDGQGARLAEPSRLSVVTAILTAVVAAAWAARWWAPVPVTVAGLVLTGAYLLAARRLGGVTGDVLGASAATSIVAVMATVSALIQAGLL